MAFWSLSCRLSHLVCLGSGNLYVLKQTPRSNLRQVLFQEQKRANSHRSRRGRIGARDWALSVPGVMDGCSRLGGGGGWMALLEPPHQSRSDCTVLCACTAALRTPIVDTRVDRSDAKALFGSESAMFVSHLQLSCQGGLVGTFPKAALMDKEK